ncbi:hypothetical protein [Chitinophaga eiseniae]|uniref:AAA ATPase domain-containing protein n=1 Tax=Chitinophaga eiseniae TaxID=634771 RepID=A0A847SAM0_9BACT|nr:hypothetical protein [Chitinophaga eiseniae]NLR80260.1 hypothetical protein [Chitinophaga eiseniae]
MSILLYNPDRKNKADFIAEFVIRTKIFDEIMADIKTGKMTTPEQHYLLLGQRGAGKTTMLLRLKYAVEDDAKLSKWLIPVIFSEEQYNIGELGNLWERIAEYLEDYHGFDGITNEIIPFIQQDNYEEAALKVLIHHLDRHKKKVILFIDNIGQLLAKFDDLEVRRLREILQTIPHFRLIAGSPVVLESILDYQQPLFEFFKVIQLKGLTDEESIALLRQLAVLHHEEAKIERIIKNSPSRITTLRTLSGGVPRTMVLLFQVFVDHEHGTALSDLEQVLDAVTPLYKHRMDDLPAQQQKIVDAVALHWEAVSVKDLAKQTRLDSKLVSAQLRQLEKNQVIEKRATKTKNHIYLLRERFFNIWYLMRYGRKQDRNRVVWLVKFLEAWCDKDEIERRVKDYIEKAKKGMLANNVLETYGHVYTFFKDLDPETKFLLKESTPDYVASNIDLTEDEFYQLLRETLREKKLDVLQKIASSRRFVSIAEKDRLWLFIETNLELLSEAFWSQTAKKITTSDKNVKLNNSYFLTIVAFRLVALSLVAAIAKNYQDKIEYFVSVLVRLLPYFKGLELSTEERASFERIIVFLHAGKFHSLANMLFEKMPFSKEEVSTWRRVNAYMESNQQDVIFDLGEEQASLILTKVDFISLVRKLIEEERTQQKR